MKSQTKEEYEEQLKEMEAILKLAASEYCREIDAPIAPDEVLADWILAVQEGL